MAWYVLYQNAGDTFAQIDGVYLDPAEAEAYVADMHDESEGSSLWWGRFYVMEKRESDTATYMLGDFLYDPHYMVR